MKILILLLPFFLFILKVHGQETLSLEDAIKIALDHNYSIQIVKKNAEVSKNNINRGNAGMLPKIDLNTSINTSNSDINLEFTDGRTIEQKGNISNSIAGAIELNWTLFDGFGMYILYEKLKLFKESSDIEVQIAIENTLSVLITTYYETVRLQQDLQSFKENMAISKERLLRVQNRIEFGASVKLEVLHSQVDLNRDSSTYLQTELALAIHKRNINWILGRSPIIDFSLDDNFELIELFTIEYIVESASKRNTTVNRAIANKNITELDYKALKATKYPRIMLNSSYGYNKSESAAGWVLVNQNVGLSAGITASVNIFNGFKKNTQTQNAIIAMDISDLQYEEIKNEIELNIYNSYDTYLKRFEILQLEKQNLETAQQNFNKSKEFFQLGQITSTELREAQLNLLKTKNSINYAFFLTKIAETELLLLSGNLLGKLE